MPNNFQSESAVGAERRQFDRRRVLESGVIITAEGRIDCQVVDFSPGGVCVRPVEPLPTSPGPIQFQFARIGVFDSQIRWRDGDAAGLGFAKSPDDIADRCRVLLEPTTVAS